MLKDIKWFEMADELETSAANLKVVKDLLAVSMDGLFVGDTGLLPYHQQFGAVLECAFDRVVDQTAIIDEIALCLHEINRELKREGE